MYQMGSNLSSEIKRFEFRYWFSTVLYSQSFFKIDYFEQNRLILKVRQRFMLLVQYCTVSRCPFSQKKNRFLENICKCENLPGEKTLKLFCLLGPNLPFGNGTVSEEAIQWVEAYFHSWIIIPF